MRCGSRTSIAQAKLREPSAIPPLLAEERDYMRVLGRLVKEYEEKTMPMRPSTDAEILQFLMEANNLNQSQMAAAMSIPASTVSEILKGRRVLTRTHIGRLTARFRISSEAFFGGEHD